MDGPSSEDTFGVTTALLEIRRSPNASVEADRGEDGEGAGGADKPSDKAEINHSSNERTQASGTGNTEEDSDQFETWAPSAQILKSDDVDNLSQMSRRLPLAPSTEEPQLSPVDSTDSRQWPEPPRITSNRIAPLFRESRISIAVDVSGSTYGPGLAAEARAIRDICSLFPRSARSDIRILPWSHYASRPISLDDLDELDPDGDTKPSVLLHDADCRYELQRSSFWFLMTDGDILAPDVRQFARELVEYGLHGLACVIAIFGEREQTPANCNVSVGLSVFAVSPHCAFLYTDIGSNETYVLQTKGCFSALLPKGKSNPRLTQATRWTDLPRTSYENLSRVQIPLPQSVSKDEVVLGDNTRLNLLKLFESPEVDTSMANRILDNEDNLKTIALTAKLKGQTEQLRRWLDSVEKASAETWDLANVEKLHGGQQSDLLVDAMTKLLAPESPEEGQKRAQTQTREANTQDIKFLEVQTRLDTARSAVHRRQSSINHVRKVSLSSFDLAKDNIGGVEYEVPPDAYGHRSRFPSSNLEPIIQAPPAYSRRLSSTSLFTPGFQKPEFQKDFFKGRCNLCASNEHVMALLLRVPPGGSVTANFPRPQSSSNLVYPLTMGNYPETDIISSVPACDPCSFRMAERGTLPSGESIVASLPLVSFAKNRLAWLETINVATQKRFCMEDLPLVFLSIMYTKMERILNEENVETTFTLRAGLEWACVNLLREVHIVPKAHPQTLSIPWLLQDYILQIFKNTLDEASFVDLLRYPLDGFVVANVALSESRHKIQLSAQKRKRVVFLRFLYHLAEQYQLLASECDGLVLEALKILILQQGTDSNAPPSLLDLDRMRQLSVINARDLLQSLQRRMVRRQKKTQHQKLSISVSDLLKTPMLDEETCNAFRRLGGLFSWIDDQAGHAIAAFMHYLFCMEVPEVDASDRFVSIRTTSDMSAVMLDPGGMSAKKVDSLVEKFQFL
ncbi:uncharacterized protein Z518_04431 [Rhinocladiella mackenziei CBS 650.93]|uniref:Uncharacterized protein n=1 Tax=Rhinocladiella mackenziei CBS 650.93 TaxID=1442369 RepID=A0A0D2JBH9_9EURO|nr:uncharacterized protein Z518_04431 [Rhinocladiella mackenziei CBS 650.93]KIX06455.1 hypothetical protein Z518_04431 [Rhinocladiella mackenziei CBS 650.93]